MLNYFYTHINIMMFIRKLCLPVNYIIIYSYVYVHFSGGDDKVETRNSESQSHAEDEKG